MTDLCRLTLAEASEGLRTRAFSVSELVRASLDRIKATEPEIRACLTVMEQRALDRAAALEAAGPQPGQLLWGLPLALEDLFCVKDVKMTCASRMLENFHPSYDARVTQLLLEAGAVLVAKTNLDEFGLGSSTEYSAFFPTRNPWDLSKVPGGSSGGAAASVAAYQTAAAIGADSGGSVRQPAALCGCVGLKPTYGRVSRYGLAAGGSSFDQAGLLARRALDCAMILAALAGPDEKDSTAARRPAPDYPAESRPRPLRELRLGLPKELWQARLSSEVERVLQTALKKLEESGVRLVEVCLPHLEYAAAAYYILASAEASTNLARFDGVRYGCRVPHPRDLQELYVGSRSQALGPEVQRRILLGAFALSSDFYETHYKKAAQVRRLIQEEHLAALARCDLLIAPVTPATAWPFGRFTEDPLAVCQMDMFTLPASLAGLPALSLPAGLGSDSGLPVGLQLIGRPFEEAGLLAAGRALEEEALPPLL